MTRIRVNIQNILTSAGYTEEQKNRLFLVVWNNPTEKIIYPEKDIMLINPDHRNCLIQTFLEFRTEIMEKLSVAYHYNITSIYRTPYFYKSINPDRYLKALSGKFVSEHFTGKAIDFQILWLPPKLSFPNFIYYNTSKYDAVAVLLWRLMRHRKLNVLLGVGHFHFQRAFTTQTIELSAVAKYQDTISLKITELLAKARKYDIPEDIKLSNLEYLKTFSVEFVKGSAQTTVKFADQLGQLFKTGLKYWYIFAIGYILISTGSLKDIKT